GLYAAGMEPTHVEPLFRSDALGGVRRLDLRANRLGDEGAKLLAECSALTNLRILDLAHNRIGPKGIRALARSPHLEKLARLDLGWNQELGSEGLRELLSASFLPNLRALNLTGTGLQPGDLAALASCPVLSGLRRLVLNANAGIGEEDVKALAQSSCSS